MNRADYMREWRQKPENRDRIRLQKQASYQRNKEAILAQQREYYQAHREIKIAAAKRRRDADPEAYRRAQTEQRRRWTERNPEVARLSKRRAHLRNRYALEWDEYQRLLLSQQGACAICRKTRPYDLQIDHDHRTGRVRGLLCRVCNNVLGGAKDDPDLLRRAIAYLGS